MPEREEIAEAAVKQAELRKMEAVDGMDDSITDAIVSSINAEEDAIKDALNSLNHGALFEVDEGDDTESQSGSSDEEEDPDTPPSTPITVMEEQRLVGWLIVTCHLG